MGQEGFSALGSDEHPKQKKQVIQKVTQQFLLKVVCAKGMLRVMQPGERRNHCNAHSAHSSGRIQP